MKKEYISPELEVIRLTLADVILSSPTDQIGGNGQIDEPSLPGDEDPLGDL